MIKQKSEKKDKQDTTDVKPDQKTSPTEEEIQDFQTYNPLYDYKLIRGKFFAIQSNGLDI